jgi:hypothetical protein
LFILGAGAQPHELGEDAPRPDLVGGLEALEDLIRVRGQRARDTAHAVVGGQGEAAVLLLAPHLGHRTLEQRQIARLPADIGENRIDQVLLESLARLATSPPSITLERRYMRY